MEVMTLFANERKVKIMNLLNESQSLLGSEAAQALDVSETTIRRDLQDLEEQGFLKRTHGGAITLDLASFEPSMREKADFHLLQKNRIAMLANSYIQPGDTILLDSGTTTLQIARKLPDQEMIVVTNSLPIASELAVKKKMKLVVLGGELRVNTAALVGPFAECMLQDIHVDKLFLGTNGIDTIGGMTTPNVTEANTKRAMIRASRQIILVADCSKFGQVHFAKIAEISDLDTVITDEAVDDDLAELFSRHSIKWVTPANSKAEVLHE